jgi:putative ABC transport system ATP-binding protein
MATLGQPKVLLLDEHLASLDPRTAEAVMQLTARLVAEGRLTTLMVTHNMHEAMRWGSRLVMMHEGRVILDVAGDDKARLTAATRG